MTDIDFAGLMEESPGGTNYGRAASTDPHSTGRRSELSADASQTHEFLQDGGFAIVETTRGSGGLFTHGAADAGMTTHRSVLAGDEYVDESALLAAVEHELDFTIEDVRSVYRQGRMTETQRELRGLIDSRLLALSRSGANLLELARIFGWTIKPASARGGASCDTMERAIARARSAETVAA